MPNLFTTLTSASRALDAQRHGLDVVGQNLANVNTPGYSRRTVELASVQPDAPNSAGRGVDVIGIRALRDQLLDTRLSREVAPQMREDSIAQGLSIVESSLGQPGASIDAALDQFFDAFGVLAQNPASAVARQQVVTDGAALAAAFNDMSTRFTDAREDADRHIRSVVSDVNRLTARVARLNDAISAAPSEEASLHLRDDLAVVVRQLSELTGATVRVRPEGGADVAIGNGRPLVVGVTSYAIEVQSAPPLGLASLSVASADVTAATVGGRLAGLLHVRDAAVPGYVARLDDLAYALAERVNAAHATAVDGHGDPGGAFFVFSGVPAGHAGAARMLQLAAPLAADASRVVASESSASGGNAVARAIAGLRANPMEDGAAGTFADHWAELVYIVGRDVRSAADERDGRAEVVRQVDALRDQVSGVSLDEEAMLLMKFQRAYEANARFFRAIDDALTTLMETVR